jgi:hypothetical protein
MNETNIVKNYDMIIGIDTGTNTGFAVWNVSLKQFVRIETLKIHQAFFKIKNYIDYGWRLKILVEDARLRKWYGSNSTAKLQGAGSIKRDCSIWEDFLKDEKIDFELIAPKNVMTKLSAESFKNITKYEGKTNEHNRDAAMLCFNRSK